MRCAKIVEPIECSFEMLRQVGLGNILHGDVDATTGRDTFGGVWPVEKHCKA